MTRMRNNTPCLSFEVELSDSNSCTHDVPVGMLPRKRWGEIKKPDFSKPKFGSVLNDVRQLKNLVERYKNLGTVFAIEVTDEGRMKLSLETDEVNVDTHFKNLPVEKFEDDGVSKVCKVRGDLRRLYLCLTAALDATASRKCSIRVIEDELIHLVVGDFEEVGMDFYIPAIDDN